MGVFSFLGIKPQVAQRSNQNAYNFSFAAISGGNIDLSQFQGKVVLIANTASECGFTRQYKGLEDLYLKYKDRGFVVLGVPSNDFGSQEPGSNEEIRQFCEAKFNITFPLTAKTVVSGEDAHGFYKWAADELGYGTKPKWNFHKYLVNCNGNLVDYFNSTTSPGSERVAEAIEALLHNSHASQI